MIPLTQSALAVTLRRPQCRSPPLTSKGHGGPVLTTLTGLTMRRRGLGPRAGEDLPLPDTKLTRREALAAASAAAALAADGAGVAGAAQPVATFPDDPFSRPAAFRTPHFETMAGCQISGDVKARATTYRTTSLSLDTASEPYRTLWCFNLRAEGQAVLVLAERVRHAPSAVTFRAANLSSRPITFSMQMHEMPWQPGKEGDAVAWGAGGPRLEPGQEALLRFDFAAAKPSKPVERGPACPLGPLVIAAQGLEAGIDYTLRLGEFTLHTPPAPSVASRFECRAELQAGTEMAAALHLARGGSGGLSLELRRDPWVLWRVHLTDDEARQARSATGVQLRRTLPWYVRAGRYRLGLAEAGLRAAGAEADLTVRNSRRPPLPRAESRTHNGRRSLVVDGKPVAWRGYASYDYQPGNVAEFGAHGANVLCVPTCAGLHVYQITWPTWVTSGRTDFGELDEAVAFSLQANPEALLFLRVSMALPHFWSQQHPDEIALADMEPGRVPWLEYGSTPGASMGSETWRRTQAQALRALIRYCKVQPWASRLIGFWVCGGTTEEWFAWGSNDGRYTDYSAPAQRAFDEWLDENRLQGLPPGEASPPAPAQRRAPGRDLYEGTPQGAWAAAYHQHLSDLVVDTIAYLARVVKEETAGRSLVCTFHGYVLQLAGEPRQALSGHFALRRLLACPDVDVLGGIPLFEGRDLTNGYASYVTAYESVHASGKLYCNENDLFSWLHHSLWHTLYDANDPRAAAISLHRRACAEDAVCGAMAQKFSLLASWHHDAQLQRDFARQASVYASALAMDRSPVEEVAFVVDDATFAWTPPESTYLAYAHKHLLLRLARTGAPVGVWLLSDLHRLPARIRCVVIASGAAARPEELEGLRDLLRRGGRTVVAVGPLGLVDLAAGRWRPEAVASLLELPLVVEDRALPGSLALTDGGRALGGPGEVRPRVHSREPGALRFSDGAWASAERALPKGGRLVWCGAPPCDTALLRGWLQQAGVHLYAPENFSVHAARGLVSITAATAGAFELAWPRPVAVTDLFDGWTGRGARFECPFAAGQTRLFKVARMG